LIVVSALGAATSTFTAGPAGAAGTDASAAARAVVSDDSGRVSTKLTVDIPAGATTIKADVDWQV
jgi:hypothetical protein